VSALLTYEGVTKRYGAREVLRGVSLEVMPGRSLVIIGTSGAGKSVTLRCGLGLERADAGVVRFEGVDLAAETPTARAARLGRMGMLFQGGALFDALPVWENVAFRPIHRGGVARRTARELAISTLAKVNLAPSVADQLPSELSGGMQKRVALARAIVDQPELLFFDEPTTGLDPITADAVNRLIRTTVTGLGAAAVTITHDLASARFIGDEIALLHEGVIRWRGGPEELDTTDEPHVRQFVAGLAEGPIRAAL
jgi:phospholipid/cholesterol/gamma-HCH transport system ATP-binding protein